MSYFCGFIVSAGVTILGLGLWWIARVLPVPISPPPGEAIVAAQLLIYLAAWRGVAVLLADLAARPSSTSATPLRWIAPGIDWLADPAPRWLLLFAIPTGAAIWLSRSLLWAGFASASLWGIGLVYTVTLIIAALHPDRAWRLALPFAASGGSDHVARPERSESQHHGAYPSR